MLPVTCLPARQCRLITLQLWWSFHRSKTSPHFHEDQVLFIVFNICGDLCRCPGHKKSVPLPIEPFRPHREGCTPLLWDSLQACFGQAAVAGVKTITRINSLWVPSPEWTYRGQLKRSVSISPATGPYNKAWYSPTTSVRVGLRGGDALRPLLGHTSQRVLFHRIDNPPCWSFHAQPTTVTTGLPRRTDRLSLSDAFCVTMWRWGSFESVAPVCGVLLYRLRHLCFALAHLGFVLDGGLGTPIEPEARADYAPRFPVGCARVCWYSPCSSRS